MCRVCRHGYPRAPGAGCGGPSKPSPVDPEDVPRLFDRCSGIARPGVRTKGLGLAIARDLARAMGGDIRYEHGSPGSRFILTLAASA
ncbi:MAG: sensor histidine kinase [Acidimicrobiales bacterium]